MEFVRTTGWEKGTEALAERLTTELQKHKHVLWLVCGGSNIAAAVKVMDRLPAEITQNLVILLTDERYGEFGHSNSNAKQLHEAGFQPKDAIFTPVLAPGFSATQTRERYELAIKQAVEHADIVIAQFGIGADGHIAGILPHSAAASANGWVNIYEAPPFIRATLTFEALRHIDAAYAMVFGKDKKAALALLHDENLPLLDQPSQILKQLPEAYVFNDQIGEKV